MEHAPGCSKHRHRRIRALVSAGLGRLERRWHKLRKSGGVRFPSLGWNTKFGRPVALKWQRWPRHLGKSGISSLRDADRPGPRALRARPRGDRRPWWPGRPPPPHVGLIRGRRHDSDPRGSGPLAPASPRSASSAKGHWFRGSESGRRRSADVPHEPPKRRPHHFVQVPCEGAIKTVDGDQLDHIGKVAMHPPGIPLAAGDF